VTLEGRHPIDRITDVIGERLVTVDTDSPLKALPNG
jgi:hypothetical protein